MVPTSKLCSACIDIFRGEEGKRQLPQRRDHISKKHHRTLHQLLEAVRDGCFVCSIVWKRVGEDYQADCVDGHAISLSSQYRIHTEEGRDDTVSLKVFYRRPSDKFWRGSGFHLTPFEGMLEYVS